MSGRRVALDTNVAIAIMAAQADSVADESVAEFLLPVTVVGELHYGALNSRRKDENLVEVERLASRCRVLEVTRRTAALYAGVRLGLKQKGKPIPENDIWIAALCLEHDAALRTSDSHFDGIEGLKRDG